MLVRYSKPVNRVFWFLRLWLGVATVVAMLVALEMGVLVASGYRYHSMEHVENVLLRDLSLMDSENRAAVFCFRERESTTPVHTKVHLYDGLNVPEILSIEGSDFYRVALSIDRRLAITSWQGEVFLWQLPERSFRTGNTLQTLTRGPLYQAEGNGCFENIGFSPNGQFLAANGEDGCFVWNTDTRKRLNIATQEREEFVCFFPDSKRLLTTSQNGVLRIRDTLDPQSCEEMHVGSLEIRAATVSPNAELAFISNSIGQLKVWSFAEKKTIWKKHETRLARHLAMNNEFVAFVGSSGLDIKVCDAKSGNSVRVVQHHDQQLIGLTISQDKLYSWDVSGQIREVQLSESARDVKTSAIAATQ